MTPWCAAAVDAPALWAASGGQWLTTPGVPTPTALVRAAMGAIARSDERGAGIADEFPAGGLGVIGQRAAFGALTASGRASCGGATRMIPAVDAWIAVSIARPSDVSLIPAWLEIDPVDDDPWPAVERAVARMSAVHLRDRAALLGLACCVVGEAALRSEPVLAELVGSAPATDVSELVVVNLASLWAGPLAATLLGRMGARVITVESTARPDGTRATPEFFGAMHEGHDIVAFDFAQPDDVGRLRSLLRSADILIEGSRPRALAQLGIDATELARWGPRVWISITAHGRSSPHDDRTGFGDDAAAAGGLIGKTSDGPVFIADAIADPLTGLAAAATAADLVERGGRWLVDVALSRVAASMANAAEHEEAQHEPSPPSSGRRNRPMRPIGADTDRVLAEFGI